METGPFNVGEKVLVPHTDKYYEAKVIRAQYREDGMWYYFLHYTGWNKKWDEWVEETGLQKSPHGAASRKLKDKTGKKRSLQDIIPEASPVTIDIEVPPLLKKQLIDEHEYIMSEGKLVDLPRRPNVNELLQQYVSQVHAHRGSSDVEEDTAWGLRTYFDKALYQCLLYAPEREQANKVLSNGRVPCSVYGAEHFLRLFTKLPDLLPLVPVPDEQVAILQSKIADVLQFLLVNQSSLFLSKQDYISQN